MALCLSIFSRENALLHVQCSEKELHRERELHQFAYCSVDVIEEKGRLSTSKAQELYLGVLLLNASFRSYGYLTNTNVKFVIVVDVANSNLKDQDIRAIFKRLHTSYCKAIANPFYVIDSNFESSKLRSAVAEILDH